MASFLFVGAPFGPFFKTVVTELEKDGHTVLRIVTHGGEWIETPSRCRIRFSGRPSDFKPFLRSLLRERRVNAVVTFNDTLPLQRIALDLADTLNLHTFVLEQGYIRPYWVTLERDGVNGFSRLPRDPNAYRDPKFAGEHPPHQRFSAGLRHLVIQTIQHFAGAVALMPVLGLDLSYYGDSVFRQAFGYSREYIWRLRNDETRTIQKLESLSATSKTFMVIMQKPGDAQLVVHSRHGGNLVFLKDVFESFSKFAPPDGILVVKQHPLDYGTESLPHNTDLLTKQYGLEGRVLFVRKTSIDRIMPHIFAVLTINSTAGLASIIAQKPVFCAGRAFYDIPGLTSGGTMDAFWKGATPPDSALVKAFISFLLKTSQLNGGFHTLDGLAILVPAIAKRLTEGVRLPAHVTAKQFRTAHYARRHGLSGLAVS